MNHQQLVTRARSGDIDAFERLYSSFHESLKSYLFRLTASRNDAEDLAHDAFIKAFSNINQFKGDATIKTWVFQIATNLAYNLLKRRKRWTPDVLEKAKELVMGNEQLAGQLASLTGSSPDATYDIQEHIDTCFTCMGKTLPIENQVALMLKDIYAFSVQEIMLILDKTEGTVKYLLQNARKTMTDIFDQRCSLVSKEGVCHQCSELNGWFNPKQNQQEALMKVKMVKESKKFDRDKLFEMRTHLVQSIDPLRSTGFALQEALMDCNRMAMGEKALS